MSDLDQLSARPAHPSFSDAERVWARIGVLSFGGPAGQIALMHRELVDERRWISESRFLHALNFCMLLPGPEAQQLATYIGWLLHGWRGGLLAGMLFLLPGFLVILGLSAIYAVWGQTGLLDSAFMGLKAAVLVIVVEALIRVGRRSLKNTAMRAIAVAAFLALFAFAAPFPLVILTAALIGYAGFRLAPDRFSGGAQHVGNLDRPAVIDADHPGRPASWRGSILAAVIWSAAWLLPFGLLSALGLGSSVYQDIGLFFSKMAVVTFGGAYAVLSYVAQEAAGHFHWLKPGEMLDGLGLAETTPGPLVLVLSFVGFIAGFREPGALPPLVGGMLGATLTTWVTFAPCFLWIFLGAPWIERLRANQALSGAMTAISAAVTGVIFNLALWFASHVLFARHIGVDTGPLRMNLPDPTSLDLVQLALTTLAAIALFRLKLGVFKTLALLAGTGVLVGLAF
jgi:chromate transporter